MSIYLYTTARHQHLGAHSYSLWEVPGHIDAQGIKQHHRYKHGFGSQYVSGQYVRDKRGEQYELGGCIKQGHIDCLQKTRSLNVSHFLPDENEYIYKNIV